MKLLSFLFCDDVRMEANGKLILVGVYDSGIVFPANTKFPAGVPALAFFCRFQLEGDDRHFDEVEVKFHLNGKAIMSLKAAVAVKDFKLPISIFRSMSGFQLPSTGNLEFEMVLSSKGEVVGDIKPGSMPIQMASSAEFGKVAQP